MKKNLPSTSNVHVLECTTRTNNLELARALGHMKFPDS